jgi:hypothetical protein
MLRFFTRIVALSCLVAALCMGVVDGTRALGSDRLEFTPLGTLALWAMPRQFPLLEPTIGRYLYPWLWDPFLTNFLLLPAVFVFFALSAILLVLARRRHVILQLP